MTIKAITPLLLLCICTAPALSLARKSDRQQPILTSAKVTSAYNAANSVTTLTGSVKTTQGSLVVTGDVARLYFDANQQLSRIVVTGHPAHMQQLDEQGRLVQGDAQTLDYDNINGIAVLTTDAVVKVEGQGEVHADKLTYNVDTTQMIGESSSDGVVHGTILPKPKTNPESGGTPLP